MADTPTLTIETITPAKAQKMLAHNVTNRNIRDNRVRLYAQDMAAGNWKLTGEPIIINGTTLVNGQHRLLACIEADVPFKTAVFRGAGDDVYAVVDSGLTRSASDMLGHDGIKNAARVAAAARLVIGYRTDTLHNTNVMQLATTRLAIGEEVANHLDRYDTLGAKSTAMRKAGFNTSAYITLAVILGEIVGEDECDDWLTGAADGIGLEAGDSRLALRSWVIGARRSTSLVELSAWIRARNAYALNEPRTQIKPWFKGTKFPRLVEET